MTRTNVLSSKDITLVLVHGALTGPSVWNEVIRQLQAADHRVLAPVLPMRSLHGDAAYLASALARVEGPVVLVGHSYAGAVISHPAVVAPAGVKALVFVAAFQPEEGESAGELNDRFPGTLLTADNLDVVPNPLGGHDLTLQPARFADVYAADVEPEHAAVMAVSQHPIDPAALGETFLGTPTWHTTPSWALISTEDRSLVPAVLRFMAERAASQTVEIRSSHAAPVSQPGAVTDLIKQAVQAVSPFPPSTCVTDWRAP